MERLKKAIESAKKNERFNRGQLVLGFSGLSKDKLDDIRFVGLTVKRELMELVNDDAVEYKKLAKIVIDIMLK
jgi:hypothetical protein